MYAFWRVPRGARARQSRAAFLAAPALLSWLLLSAMASSAMAERLPLRKYTTEDGLAHARVRRIVRDPRGFLWFCTVDGLSRFDGAEFVTYRTGDGLPDPWVTDVLATRDGAYWVATNAGVAIFDPFARAAANDRPPSTDDRARQFFTRVASEGSPAHRQVRVLLEDRAGRIWAGGQGGLSILDRSGSTLKFRPVVPGLLLVWALVVVVYVGLGWLVDEDKKADYLLVVKGNQPKLFERLADLATAESGVFFPSGHHGGPGPWPA